MIDPIFVEFKSDPKFYKLEKTYRKNNTVRKYKKNDPRFKILKKVSEKDVRGSAEYAIRIVNSENKESFERFIKDVSIWEGLYIITWDQEV